MSKLDSVNKLEPPRERKHNCEHERKWRTTKLLGSASKIRIWNPVFLSPRLMTVKTFKTFPSNLITFGYKKNVAYLS